MAGKLSTRDFDEEEVKWLAQFAAAAKDPLPHDPRNLRAILRALQHRLHDLNPAEANLVSGLIQSMAAIERNPLFALAPDTQQKLCEQYVGAIAHAKPTGGSHNESVLRLQRDFLAHYLAARPYPTKSPGDRWRWVKENWADILKAVLPLPCYHDYVDRNVRLGIEYDELNLHKQAIDENELNSVTVSSCEADGQILRLILAHLHGTTPANIHKLLKPAS